MSLAKKLQKRSWIGKKKGLKDGAISVKVEINYKNGKINNQSLLSIEDNGEIGATVNHDVFIYPE